MNCRHCGKKTNLSEILCDVCAEKALQILPTDPEERILIYQLLMKSDNFVIRMCAEQLLKQDAEKMSSKNFDSWISNNREV